MVAAEKTWVRCVVVESEVPMRVRFEFRWDAVLYSYADSC